MIELVKTKINACCYCNTKSRAVVFYDYYDTPLAPYCIDCFVYVMNDLLKRYDKAVQKINQIDKNLEQEKLDNLDNKCRTIFAKHILNGDREEAVKEFWNVCQKYKKDIN